ncbi:vasoactive intestinal polypeptide receptor 2 isoform X2 [Phycodurus eques]|uniref:vasoactive intestinal polypeptide receptor 2 isoform X2 n=1 Tax=Phycodurus eques TaxID=693459 RepID=UPI002ACD5454|nr:vasoactive intestinal polypeptide receptor 2 isoform X2 [Phycodurus eques]
MKSFILFLAFFSASLLMACGRHPTCNFLVEVEKDHAECVKRLKEEERRAPHEEAGCKGTWDNVTCWEHTGIGQTATIPCPRFLTTVFGTNGNISRKCTASGWSDVFPNITSACGSDTRQDKLVFYVLVQTLYTLGHSLSLIFLTTGSAVLCFFRKLHCTRNSIHLNLFLSFILRAAAVLAKDHFLFGRAAHCSAQPSLVACRASLVLLQYFIMANFFWLLVEALYLHTLLVAMFSQNTHFVVYMLIGWGIPSVIVFTWVLMRIYLEDTGSTSCSLSASFASWCRSCSVPTWVAVTTCSTGNPLKIMVCHLGTVRSFERHRSRDAGVLIQAPTQRFQSLRFRKSDTSSKASAVGQVDSPAHSVVWDPLCGLCVALGIHGRRLQDLFRPGPRILPGSGGCHPVLFPQQ